MNEKKERQKQNEKENEEEKDRNRERKRMRNTLSKGEHNQRKMNARQVEREK